MELWIPISEVLPNFKKNTSKIGTLKRKVSDSIEDTIEFSKTDNGKKFLKVGGAILTVGAAALLLAKQLGHDANNEEVSDSQSDEIFPFPKLLTTMVPILKLLTTMILIRL